MTDYLLPDAKRAVRTYLRSLNLGGLVGSRVVFRFTEDWDSWPAVRLTQTSVTPDSGAPLWVVGLAIDVYGRPADTRGPGTSADVDKVTRHLVSVLFELENVVVGDTLLGGVTVGTVTDSDDPVDGGPRALLTTDWTVRAASAVA